MEHRRLMMLVLFALVAVVAACSGVTPQTKSTSSESRITEEDVTADRSIHQQPETQGQQPAFSGPPAPPVEDTPGLDPAGSRQPRRYHWRDRKGGGKSWSTEEPGAVEP